MASGEQRGSSWAHPDSNQEPAGYEPDALPLSYGPEAKIAPNTQFRPQTELKRTHVDGKSVSRAGRGDGGVPGDGAS